MNRISRLAMTVLMSGGMGLAGLGLSTGTAQALPQWHPCQSGTYGGCWEWCPGAPMYAPHGPGTFVNWDMNVCHSFRTFERGIVDDVTGIYYQDPAFRDPDPNVPPPRRRHHRHRGLTGGATPGACSRY